MSPIVDVSAVNRVLELLVFFLEGFNTLSEGVDDIGELLQRVDFLRGLRGGSCSAVLRRGGPSRLRRDRCRGLRCYYIERLVSK